MQQPIFLNATQIDPTEGIDAGTLGATPLPENPFVGLRPFEPTEEMLFFGRREQTKALLKILHASRFVAVVGSSGCGKSSLIRAGLIPNLEAGFLAGSIDRWNVVTMKPGNSPLINFAAALLTEFHEKPVSADVDKLVEDMHLRGVSAVIAFLKERTNAERNVLLLVDQFEEIFRFAFYEEANEKTEVDTAATDQEIKDTRREEADDFVAMMLELAQQDSLPIYVVMTMRSDFLGECDAFSGLPEVMNQSQYLVPRLTRQQRQEAIKNPIRLYGAEITNRLTDRVLNDMEDERDQLPIMQHALMRTWEKWQIEKKGALDLPHYIEAGTIDDALSRDAEEALEGMSENQRFIAERMFQSLVTTDAKGRRMRRPVRLSEIVDITDSNSEVVCDVIGRFRSNNRCFLMLSDDRDPLVDISHESLIRQWETLRKWVDDEVESRELYLRLATDAVRHRANQAPLWSDPALQLALNWWNHRQPTEAWARRYHKEFKLTEDFLKRSEKRRSDEAAEAERLKNEEVTREREELEKAQKYAEQQQRLAEIEKKRAQELADARQRELEAAQAMATLEKEQAEERDKAKASILHRTRVFAFVVVLALFAASITALWALKAEARARKNLEDANDARSQLEIQKNELKQNRDDLQTANLNLTEEKKKADEAKQEAEIASKEAKAQASLANTEKSKAVEALKNAHQTAAADKLRRDAASEENAAEIEAAQATFLKAIGAYGEIKDKEGVAYTYYELGSMLAKQDDDDEPFGVADREIGVADRNDREYWNEIIKKSNWVDQVLLGGGPFSKLYFDSIGISSAQAQALNDYGEAIKAYRQVDGAAGFNGVAAVLDKVGDLIVEQDSFDPFEESADKEAQTFAVKQRAIATRDSFCAALENYKRAENLKGQIAVLDKIAGRLEQGDSTTSPNFIGCRSLGNDPARYYEESAKLYPSLLQKSLPGSNQLKKNQESFATLLTKLGRLYYDQANLNLATTKFTEAANIYRVNGDIEGTANTLKGIADGLGEGEMKRKYYELAAAEYDRVGKFEKEATLLTSIGRRYLERALRLSSSDKARNGIFETAVSYLKRAVLLYPEQSKVPEYSAAYSYLGWIYVSLLKYDEALEAYQSALKISLRIGNQSTLVNNYSSLGYVQELKGLKDEAKKSYEEIIRLASGDGMSKYYKENAETGLKRLRGELPPLVVPKPAVPEQTPKPQPSPSPDVGLGSWFRDAKIVHVFSLN